MANVNTFAQFRNLTGNYGAVETASPAVAGGAVRALLGVRADVATGLFDGIPFKIQVMAKAAASGAGNLVVNIYWDSANNTNLTTFTSDVLVIGTGNLALATASGSMFMEATLLWDSASARLAGYWNELAGIANLVTTPVAIKAAGAGALTATNPITAAGVATVDRLKFFVTTSISANGTSCSITEFSLKQV